MSKPLDKQIKELVDKVKKELEKAVASKSFYDEIGKEVSNQIRKRTRLGYGSSPSGQQVKLASLKESTVENRKRTKKKGNLSNLTTPKKSNLTETAQLLDAIEHKSTNQKVTIQFSDRRKDSKIGNKKLAGYVQQAGRRFFDLTTAETSSLKRLVEKKIQELIKRLK